EEVEIIETGHRRGSESSTSSVVRRMEKHSIQSQDLPEIIEEDMSDVDDNEDGKSNRPTDQSIIPLEKESRKRPSKDTPENKLSSKKVKTKDGNISMLKKLIGELKSPSSSTSSTTSQAESITSPSNFSDLYSAIVKAEERIESVNQEIIICYFAFGKKLKERLAEYMKDNKDSFTSAPTASLPTTEEINGLSRDEVKGFLQGRRVELDLEDDDINIIYNQRVKGDTFLDFISVDFERWGIPGAPAKKLERLIKQIKGDHAIFTNNTEYLHNLVLCFPASYRQTRQKTQLRYQESNPYLAIGTRMLFQLLREKMDLYEIIETYYPPNPMDVVKLIAKHYNRDLKSATIILVVDGMQQLMENKDDGLKLNSTFYKTLTSFADLAFSGTFMIPVCTSTITGPIDGTALEVLNDCLAGRSIEECNVDTFMNDLRYNLTKKYRDAIFSSVEEARPIARAILTRRLLNRYKPIPKTDKTPDEFVGCGLIRFEQIENTPKGYLTAPYIWLWVFVEMSQQLGDPILRDWEFADYGEQRALLNPVTSLQAKSWQSFEKFVASFRCIKSAVIEEDELTTISEVHAGARLNGDIQFKNHNLQLEVAKRHTDTRSKTLTGNEWDVDCYNSTVDVRQFKHCIINAPASPYGDSFLSLDQPGTE
ncbi:16884_t:CDS:2, partial [Racocetra fulgida]